MKELLGICIMKKSELQALHRELEYRCMELDAQEHFIDRLREVFMKVDMSNEFDLDQYIQEVYKAYEKEQVRIATEELEETLER